MSTYTASVVNVNNNFQPRQCYLSATIALAQWIDEAVVIFDADKNVIYKNNRFGSFNGTRRGEVKTVNAVCRYLAGNETYSNVHVMHNAILQVYDTHTPIFIELSLKNEAVVDFRIIPAIEDHELIGVVLIGKMRDRRSKIRSGDCERQKRIG